MVAFQEFPEVAFLRITQEVGKGLVDFLAGGGAGAFVKFAVQRGIELKEIEALHVEPLVHKARDEFIGAGVGDESIHLLPDDFRLAQFLLLRQFEQLLVGRGTPEEVGHAHGDLAIRELATLISASLGSLR